MSKLTPIGDRVLVTPETTPDKTVGGIIIPEQSREKPQRGTIVAIGINVKDIKEGDDVLYGKYSGTEITFEEKKYLILRAGDCFATIEK